jgi:hypothetical protein
VCLCCDLLSLLLSRNQRCSALRPAWSTVAGEEEEELVYIPGAWGRGERAVVADRQWAPGICGAADEAIGDAQVGPGCWLGHRNSTDPRQARRSSNSLSRRRSLIPFAWGLQ